MGENLSQMIQMSMSAFLFIFALTYGIFSYNRINANADSLISMNIESRHGTAANAHLQNEDDIARKTDYSEIIMSTMNMIKSGMINENFIIKVVSGDTCTIQYSDNVDGKNYGNPRTNC